MKVPILALFSMKGEFESEANAVKNPRAKDLLKKTKKDL